MTADNGCMCPRCQQACQNPGWFTPEEAMLAIGAGLAKDLMLDWYSDVYDQNVYTLSPASRGRNADRAPNTNELFGNGGDWLSQMLMPLPTKGGCVLHTQDGKCSIHDSGFKPKQCRDCFGCTKIFTDNKTMSKLWDTKIGRTTIKHWMKVVQFDQTKLKECT